MASASANNDDVVAIVSALPAPALCRLAKALCRLSLALTYLFLAILWVSCASTAAAIVAGRALGTDSPVYQALDLTDGGAFFLLVFLAFLLPQIATDLRRVKRVVANVMVKKMEIPVRQVPGALIREHNVVLGLKGHALALFRLLQFLQVVGFLMGVVPGDECHRIGAALFDLRTVGVSAIGCFIILPRNVLKMRKNKGSEQQYRDIRDRGVCLKVSISKYADDSNDGLNDDA